MITELCRIKLEIVITSLPSSPKRGREVYRGKMRQGEMERKRGWGREHFP